VQVRIARNFQWIRVLPEFANSLHPVSARFAGLDLYWANPLALFPPYGVEAVPLFTTTDEAWTMREPFLTTPDFAFMAERDAPQTAAGRRILGASLSGIFPPRFDEPPAPLLGTLPPRPEPRPGRIIVIGETDFATSFMNVTNAVHNFGFLVQATDWLGHDDDIIAIRARTAGSGRLDRIADPAARAAAMRFARTVNVFVVPILVIVAGLFVSHRRKTLARARFGEAGDGAKELRHGV